MSYCCSSLAVSFPTQWRGDYTLKTWLQLLPSKDPWEAEVNQQSGHQGSLDIVKMCFRYLGKSVDTFFQCPYRAGTTCGQKGMSGTVSTHGTTLLGSRGQSTMNSVLLSDSEVEETGNIRKEWLTSLKIRHSGSLKTNRMGAKALRTQGSLLTPENHVDIVPLDQSTVLSLGTFLGWLSSSA